MSKSVFLIITLLLAGMLTLAFDIQSVKADGEIYIRANGGVEGTTSIQTADNVTYSFTADISGYIFVERDSITLDGHGHSLQGFGYITTASGIDLQGVTNVTIQDIQINAGSYYFGIALASSSDNTIFRCNITSCNDCGINIENFSNNNIISRTNMVSNSGGVELMTSSDNNSIRENTITKSVGNAIVVDTDYNKLSGNNITANGLWGIWLYSATNTNNIISGNNVEANSVGIEVDAASNNTIYHNNFINNTQQARVTPGHADFWDHGYPSGGNYWSDYNGTDSYTGPHQNETGSDGIGDTPYTIDGNNTDRYPLMKPFVPLLGDLNLDGRVDILDALLAAASFGSKPGDSRWNDQADLNKDNVINILDLILLAQNFGKTDP